MSDAHTALDLEIGPELAWFLHSMMPFAGLLDVKPVSASKDSATATV